MLPKGLLKEYSTVMSVLIRGMDILVVVLAGWSAYYVRFHKLILNTSYWGAIFLGALFTFVVFSFFGIYRTVRDQGFIKHVIKLFQAIGTVALLLAGLAFFAKLGDLFSRIWFIIWMLVAFGLLVVSRCHLLLFLRLMRIHGLSERRVVIIGAGELGVKLALTVQQALWTGFCVITFMDDHAASVTTKVPSIPVIQTPRNLSQYFSYHGIDEIWLALPLHAEKRVKEILHELRDQTITIRFALNIFGLNLLNSSLTDIAGFPVVNIRSTPMIGINRFIKAMEDRIVAVCILLLISPGFLLIALVVKLSSPGPIFFRQKRIGWNGTEFEMLKFRTMPIDAESRTGPIWATCEDTRPTKIGKWLRRTSLDELPQFINVLKGDMSIVGPRPERKVFVDEFKERIPHYMQKHLVKAGITGWAQVNGWRGNTSLKKRIEYDLYYIENWSLWFDLKIIFLTIYRGFINRNAY
jgi:putative colanic acid biosynthesis UDP-glucose lipid carrier transferase